MLVGCLCLSVAIFVCGYVNPSLDHGTNYASCWFFSVDHSRGFLPLAQLFLIGLSHQNILWCLGLIIWGCVHALAICLSGICCLLDELFISYSIGQHSNQFLKLKGEMVGEIRYASPSSPLCPSFSALAFVGAWFVSNALSKNRHQHLGVAIIFARYQLVAALKFHFIVLMIISDT